MSNVILHIDLNQFFVTCARILDPSLNSLPLAIGSEGRAGIVSTCSYEARKFGIHSGMPMFFATKLCKDLIIRDVDFNYIDLMSKEFIQFVKENLTNKIEQLSCDECYCDITELFSKNKNININNLLKNFQQNLYNKTKLQCSIGVGPTKFLAKMGSDYKKPMGITIIRKKDISNLLFKLNVDDFYGIGKKTAPILHNNKINTIGELYYSIKNKTLKPEIISLDFQNNIINCLEGNSSSKLNDFIPKSKSIGTTSTLSFDTSDSEYILNFYSNLINNVIDKMINNNYLTKTITLTLKSSNCDEGFQTYSYSHTFDNYTDNIELIKKEGINLFKNKYKGFEIRMIGFSVKNLKEKYNIITQMTFDNYKDFEKESETYLLINKINRKFNKEVVKRMSDIKKYGNK